MIFCLDTSLIVKVLINEPGSETVEALFRRWFEEDHRLITPQFTLCEIYSVLRKKNFQKSITEAEADCALRDYELLGIELLPDMPLLKRAFWWAKKLNLPVIYDSLVLAAAEKEEAVLWTCDKKFFDKAKPEFARIEYPLN